MIRDIPGIDASLSRLDQRRLDADLILTGTPIAEALHDRGCTAYAGNRTTRPNLVEAARWFSHAAEFGHTQARLILGCLYRDGQGLPKDITRAIRCWKQTDHPLAAYLLGLRGRADVAIIAATNLPKMIDSALIRPGRLGDNSIEVSYPDEAGVRSLISHLVRNGLSEADIASFAVQFGNSTSPADIVAWVEQANQRLSRAHLQAALEQITGIGAINPGLVFRVAVHELGHAAVARAIFCPEVVQSVSVRPTLSGSLGTTRFAPLTANYARGVRINIARKLDR